METWKLRECLLEIARLARQEQEHPTSLHMTCLSIIERNAKAALAVVNAAAGSELTPTPQHLRLPDDPGVLSR